MKKKIIISITLVLSLFLTYIFWWHTEIGCDLKGGHWASNGAYCITKNCYLDQSCGDWVCPAHRCVLLKTGDHISEVYFQLGNPISIDSSTYIWHACKGESILIKATIKNDRLRELNCSATND